MTVSLPLCTFALTHRSAAASFRSSPHNNPEDGRAKKDSKDWAYYPRSAMPAGIRDDHYITRNRHVRVDQDAGSRGTTEV
jgi:hypothetical protein